ncbi:hypothetical protein [Gymnodinialimonas ceratoperidinii]|uniref:DUF3325 domain-containing protein n=1 Tax=Gymnodinialimonas ceratoperidinii TaxID=2856823 RepID=A0A8F6TXB3_9RHOB|nr:hypothetical protein [Gymnodinialimonas ceratoperidinii]QXT40647.1 hypothetical protein KYE46_05260 [Gymnodinialimonas ceratoperidinii]
MSTASAFALIYATCCALPLAMQIGLAMGAPWGRFANGGRHPGVLPPRWRILAVVQGSLLAAMAWVVLARAGVIAAEVPDGLFWAALGLSILTAIANAISPSRPERLLWAPVTCAMAVSALAVAFL